MLLYLLSMYGVSPHVFPPDCWRAYQAAVLTIRMFRGLTPEITNEFTEFDISSSLTVLVLDSPLSK